MMKNAAVLALAFGTSLTLWGCNTNSYVDEYIKACNDAEAAYKKVDDSSGCAAVHEKHGDIVSEAKVKYNDHHGLASEAEKEKAEEAWKGYRDAKVYCDRKKGKDSDSSDLEVEQATSLIDLGVKHQELGKHRGHHKHAHMAFEAKPQQVEDMPHTRAVPE